MSWFGSSLAIDIALGSTSAGTGRCGGPSFGSSSFVDGSIYSHTSLVVAVSCMIKNHWVQLVSWRNLILTFRTFNLIRQFVGRSVVRSGSIVRSIGASRRP